MAVHGAGIVDDGQILPQGHAADVILVAVQQRADLGHAGAVQKRHRLEAADAALEQQIHQQRLHRVVIVVAQGDLADALFRQGGVQAAPPQFGAQGAGILLLPLLEDDLVHRHLNAGVGHLQPFAQRRHAGEVHARHAHLHGDGLHREGDGVEFLQPGQGYQRQQAVLSAADAHGDAVAGFDHMIVLHAPADKPQNMLHGVHLQK